jgi:hypothetical protein
MISVLAATATELAEFQAIRRGFLILGRHVVSTLAFITLKHNVIAWHFLISNFRLLTANHPLPLFKSAFGIWQSAIPLLNYF